MKIMALTQSDYKRMAEYVRAVVKEETLDLRQALANLTKTMPTKDDLLTQGSQIMGELKSLREETTIISDNDYQERLEKLEDIHPGYSHQPSA